MINKHDNDIPYQHQYKEKQMKKLIRNTWKNHIDLFAPKKIAFILLGAAIYTFGIHNIHQQTNITEGGVLGMILLLHHWLGLSPAIITPILDITCYAVAFKLLGSGFIKLSLISTLSVSGFFMLWELFPPLLPNLSNYPLIAAILGSIFVGVGVGIIVRQGGSSGGDDALALSIVKVTKWRISRAYLFTDLTVLVLSLSYIPFTRIAYSLVTVCISSFLIDVIHNYQPRRLVEPVT